MKLIPEITALLATVKRPGAFAAGGRLTTPIPDLTVRGVGQVAFPLLPIQAEALRDAAERAPYGRGPDTLVDRAVRDAWQLSPDALTLRPGPFDQTLDAIVEAARQGLGVTGEVRAELYKLLVYEAGSFFISHRDSEKVDGMFGTLVVVLPSRFRGGDLVVRHGGQEVTLPLSSPGPGEVAWGAFYADCLHEIRPVEEGHRLALIYNLVLKQRGPALRAPDLAEQTEAAAALLGRWAASPSRPSKLVYTLAHKYTPAGLGWGALKSEDAGVASVLREAAARAGCRIYLAMVTIEESGGAQYLGDWRYNREHHDTRPEMYEAYDEFETSQEVGSFFDPDGRALDVEALSFNDAEVAPPLALEDAEPDEQSYSEATGNEGGSFERAWRYGALVLWPRARTAQVIAEAPLYAGVGWLAELAAAAGEGDRAEIEGLARQLLDAWPAPGRRRGRSRSGSTARAKMLRALLTLGDEALVLAFFDRVLSGALGVDEAPEVAEAAARLGWATSGPRLLAMTEGKDVDSLPARARLFAALGEVAEGPEGAAVLDAVGRQIVARLPKKVKREPWDEGPPVGSDAVVDLIRGLGALGDEALTAAATAHLLAHPKVFWVDEALVPAALRMASKRARLPAGDGLIRGCLAHLRARIALPLAPPEDFARPDALSCACEDCAQLAAFLRDPKAPEWLFKANQHRRDHLEHIIGRDQADVDCQTIRQGSPYGLKCSKNQGSYRRRCQQRKEDEAAVKALAHATAGRG